MFGKSGFVRCLTVITFAMILRERTAEAHNRCLMLDEVKPKRVVQEEGRSLDITFELSRRVTQRLATRIMKIYLIEVLGYSGVSLIELDDRFDTSEVIARLSESSIIDEQSIIPETMVNMEVWVPSTTDISSLLDGYHTKECGSVAPPGYFGWFVPRRLWNSSWMDTWHTFAGGESAENFTVDDETLTMIKKAAMRPDSNDHYCSESYCHEGMYVPERCRSPFENSCALMLADNPDVTEFVKEQIDELKLFVKVVWVGPNLRNISEFLTERYSYSNVSRAFVILHWTPSDVIPNEKDFVSLVLPRCRLRDEDSCNYNPNRLVKMVWARLEYVAKFAYEAIRKTSFTEEMYEEMINRYNELRLGGHRDVEVEERVACDWLKDNMEYAIRWKPSSKDKTTLVIGGIFPMTGHTYKARSILTAASMAKEAINVNSTILRDYNLTLFAMDGKCKPDMVMTSFIQYILHHAPRLVGILGPACSETIEPLIGVSKQFNTMIISYSAEGSSFDDREKYPNFFRTIGENKQYKHVYLELLRQMEWRRVAALTEDGQKYTEYISHMQDHLQENGITFVDNAKFPRERDTDVLKRYLENLKKKRAKIIIADVYDEVARQVMCEAYKLKMTAQEGYVWFLPLWLLSRWWDTDLYNKDGENVSCPTSEMATAVNGYLGISHAYYAPDDAVMQENITVRQWRDRYETQCREQGQAPSDYAGYAYDATWTYAYAMDQLMRENQSYVFALRSPETSHRLTEIISKTDFHGVSGRIKFLGGASRISVVEIVQHINNVTKRVGRFYPNVSEVRNEVIGGNLELNVSAIVWLAGEKPNDGFLPAQRCVLASLAELLDVTCEVAIVIANIIGFGCLSVLLIVGFVVVKRKYDAKVRLHEKYMKSLGIDLLQTDTSGLDKWEIPRECVVINRKLGEGAFGTVYGGEAFFAEKGWLAVAVKTLKVGSSTEEKLDFLSEVEVMKRFEHKNIIRLLGVCIKCEPVYTVMEFMLYGDLKTYLLARRHLVNDRNYEDSDEISSKKLTAMALDVARALSYLAQLKYVHRDIASRNCLVNAQRVVKLGDFGMTRPMYENDYYKFNRKGMLPVRWMAPESLGLGIFTPASDVWSYGVLLYEIITFGSFPFQGLSNNEVLEHVKSGNTITIPSGIKSSLENLIRSCWKIDHKLRPKAPEIVDILATNPRLISPCLDVPLASVQLEHTGQIDMQLPEKFRKLSMSLNNSNRPESSRLISAKITETPLITTSEEDTCAPTLSPENNRSRFERSSRTNSDFLSPGAFEFGHPIADSSRPLLPISPEPTSKSKYVKLQKMSSDCKNDNELSARYVNIQPGISPMENNDAEAESVSFCAGGSETTDTIDEAMKAPGHEAHRMSFV
ncbi:uncharacterized protein LOC105689915 isoform X2 [Athalia rosae]|nr:uncharacterized protein LOC105689915 isoform X2 [Athalia rosae]